MKKKGLNNLLAEDGSVTAAYVVAHAAWSRKRGRGPSVSYKGETNPRYALAMAKAELAGQIWTKPAKRIRPLQVKRQKIAKEVPVVEPVENAVAPAPAAPTKPKRTAAKKPAAAKKVVAPKKTAAKKSSVKTLPAKRPTKKVIPIVEG